MHKQRKTSMRQISDEYTPEEVRRANRGIDDKAAAPLEKCMKGKPTGIYIRGALVKRRK